MIGIIETLEAEVRSKFQTQKQIEFTNKGIPVEVFFDEMLVKYQWIDERKFHIVNIILAKEDGRRAAELIKIEAANEVEEILKDGED